MPTSTPPSTIQDAVILALPPRVRMLLSLRGQYASIVTRRALKVKKGAPEIIKESRMTVRLGVDYDNQQIVQDKRDDGRLPEDNQGLIGREWLIFPYLMRSVKSGKYLLRVTPVRNGTSASSRFTVGDREVSREEAAQWAYAQEFAERETPDAFDLTVDNIVEVNGEPV